MKSSYNMHLFCSSVNSERQNLWPTVKNFLVIHTYIFVTYKHNEMFATHVFGWDSNRTSRKQTGYQRQAARQWIKDNLLFIQFELIYFRAPTTSYGLHSLVMQGRRRKLTFTVGGRQLAPPPPSCPPSAAFDYATLLHIHNYKYFDTRVLHGLLW